MQLCNRKVQKPIAQVAKKREEERKEGNLFLAKQIEAVEEAAVFRKQGMI